MKARSSRVTPCLTRSALLSGLGIVPTIHRAHQVTRDAANTVERHRRKLVANAHVLAIDLKRKPRHGAVGVLRVAAIDVRANLLLAHTRAAFICVGHAHCDAVNRHLIARLPVQHRVHDALPFDGLIVFQSMAFNYYHNGIILEATGGADVFPDGLGGQPQPPPAAGYRIVHLAPSLVERLQPPLPVPADPLGELGGEPLGGDPAPVPPVEELDLEPAEEPLAGGVVRRVPLARHRPLHPGLPAGADPVGGAVVPAAGRCGA